MRITNGWKSSKEFTEDKKHGYYPTINIEFATYEEYSAFQDILVQQQTDLELSGCPYETEAFYGDTLSNTSGTIDDMTWKEYTELMQEAKKEIKQYWELAKIQLGLEAANWI